MSNLRLSAKDEAYISAAAPASVSAPDGPVEYVRDFHWLAPFLAGFKGYSGFDIETEVEDLPGGRRSGILPHDGKVACIQIEFNGATWLVHWSKSKDIRDVPGFELQTPIRWGNSAPGKAEHDTGERAPRKNHARRPHGDAPRDAL